MTQNFFNKLLENLLTILRLSLIILVYLIKGQKQGGQDNEEADNRNRNQGLQKGRTEKLGAGSGVSEPWLENHDGEVRTRSRAGRQNPEKGREKMKTPFELFIGFTGCGYTYCNKAIEHDGNYKKLAFVDAYTGKITWYQKPERIPGYVLLRIEHDSDAIASRKGA